MNKTQLEQLKTRLKHQSLLGDPSLEDALLAIQQLEAENNHLLSSNLEGAAWTWLLCLPRDDVLVQGGRMQDHIVMRVCPAGEDGAEPYIQLSVHYPGVNNRIKGEGNTLLQAVQKVQNTISSLGIDTFEIKA